MSARRGWFTELDMKLRRSAMSMLATKQLEEEYAQIIRSGGQVQCESPDRFVRVLQDVSCMLGIERAQRGSVGRGGRRKCEILDRFDRVVDDVSWMLRIETAVATGVESEPGGGGAGVLHGGLHSGGSGCPKRSRARSRECGWAAAGLAPLQGGNADALQSTGADVLQGGGGSGRQRDVGGGAAALRARYSAAAVFSSSRGRGACESGVESCHCITSHLICDRGHSRPDIDFGQHYTLPTHARSIPRFPRGRTSHGRRPPRRTRRTCASKSSGGWRCGRGRAALLLAHAHRLRDLRVRAHLIQVEASGAALRAASGEHLERSSAASSAAVYARGAVIGRVGALMNKSWGTHHVLAARGIEKERNGGVRRVLQGRRGASNLNLLPQPVQTQQRPPRSKGA
ncbi:hypothetical protein GGX14DRAFT_409009 [Mycena pura]|uniref:Uncharacterized protein n=1 Tax=Mycena pura TaxID=153505 RepID=A0AAD6XVE8_9AGAR|nr:hypothetical protein GGX14DRAFT_409009 [Mycena pura]